MAQDNLQKALEELEAQYRAELPEKIASLEKAFKMVQANWNPALLKEVQRSVHRLAGEGGSYGFAEMGTAAKELDVMLGHILRREQQPDDEEIRSIGDYLQQIKDNSHKPAASNITQAATPAPANPKPAAPVAEPAPPISPLTVPVYLSLPEHDKKLGSYLQLQWLQVEANWKALQWSWDKETFAQLGDQLQTLLENATTFQFMALHDVAQHTDKCIREIRHEGNEPSSPQLVNLTQQIQALALVAAPLSEYEYQNKHALGRMPHARKLRVTQNDGNVNNYLVLQMQALEDLWQTLQWNWHSETLLELQNYLSVLQKNCETFASPETLDSVKNFHDGFKAIAHTGRVPNEAELGKLNRQIAKVKQAAQSLKSDATEESSLENGKHLIYVVEDDEYFSKYLDVQLEMAGYTVKIFNRILGLAEAIKRKPPAALLVDIVLTEGDLAGPRAMFQIQKGRPRPLPVIFMSARSDLRARLAAARAHGDAYLTKPLDMDVLLATLDKLTQPAVPDRPFQILLVDNVKDSGVVEYAKALREANLSIKMLNEPGRFLEAITKMEPNLILLNAHMNNVSGVELATVARQQKKYDHIPIIFYGMRFDQTWQIPVQRGIGDDFLGENIPAGQLLATVMKHLKFQKDCDGKTTEDPT